MVPSYAGGSIREGTPLYPAGGPWTEHSQLSSSNAYNAHAFEFAAHPGGPTAVGFLFDLPLILAGPALIVMLVSVALAGLGWFRKHRLPRLRFGDYDVEFGAAMLASIMVFYALATALTAVQVWESYDEVKEVNEHEASSLAALYRNVSQYPEPLRGALREENRAYTHQVIH